MAAPGYVNNRVNYLTWKYGIDVYAPNFGTGQALETLVAVQALVWAWHSDPVNGSTVFSSVAASYNDPLNWNGLTPSLHTDASPRVGFWGPDPIDSVEFWHTGTDADALNNTTQKVSDLAVEATAKAGPWSIDQGPGDASAIYVVLSGAAGPIAGETITFSATGGDVNVVTDANGHAAWPAGATTATVEAPGDTYIGGDEWAGNPGVNIQDLLVTFGQLLQVQFTDAPATPSTTITTTTIAPTTTVVALAPATTTTTTTTVAPTPATTTTTTPATAGDWFSTCYKQENHMPGTPVSEHAALTPLLLPSHSEARRRPAFTRSLCGDSSSRTQSAPSTFVDAWCSMSIKFEILSLKVVTRPLLVV